MKGGERIDGLTDKGIIFFFWNTKNSAFLPRNFFVYIFLFLEYCSIPNESVQPCFKIV